MTNWSSIGYKVVELIDKKTQKYLQTNILKIISKKINELFKDIIVDEEKLINYHNYLDNSQHYALLKNLDSGIYFKEVNFDKKILEERVSDILKIKVTTLNKFSKEINPDTFAVRIIRPGKNDFNPPHKDIYLDRLKNAVNIYMPVLGSNKKSSLPLLPESHLFNEKDIDKTENGAIVNGLKFRVPSILNTKFGLNLIRPNPSNEEIMIFSPYLIHGGGSNDSTNITRISLELRFWRS